VDLAIAAAGKLIERRLGADEDRRLVSEYLGRASGRGAN
jgi:F0F1-type ATP synthase membrane subunit b/b'